MRVVHGLEHFRVHVIVRDYHHQRVDHEHREQVVDVHDKEDAWDEDEYFEGGDDEVPYLKLQDGVVSVIVAIRHRERLVDKKTALSTDEKASENGQENGCTL